MSSVFDAPWFYWAIAVAVGFPVCLVFLTEVHNALLRRGNALARPVHLLRNYILPLGALLILLVQAIQVSGEATPVRVVATVFGFVVLVLLLSGLNATMFHDAPEGSWRKRIPSIFLDVARFALIAVGVGLIISGLLVLFEQPFQLGDWIETPTARGRVVEVNWRATHIDTGSGMMIMPNSVLAAASFTNFSRPPGTHSLRVITVFAADDPPDDVIAMLNRVAATLPQLRPSALPSSVRSGALQYSTGIPLRTPADDFAAKSQFLRWVWYASRRAGLHLDEAEDEFASTDRVQTSLQIIAPTLRLNQEDQQNLLTRVRLTRYGADEYIQYSGQVPKRMTFIVSGRVRLAATDDAGGLIPVRTLESGDFLGQTTLTLEPVTAAAYALSEVTVLQLDREDVEELVSQKPLLLQDFGRAIEERRASLRRALAAAED